MYVALCDSAVNIVTMKIALAVIDGRVPIWRLGICNHPDNDQCAPAKWFSLSCNLREHRTAK